MALHPIPQRDACEDRNWTRGARNDYTTGNISRQQSRSFNPVEYAAAAQVIEKELEDAIEAARETAAQKFLAFYRELLQPYNTSRHVIKIDAAVGSATVQVDGRNVEWECPHRGLFLLLQEIDQALDWDWAYCLNGAILNPKE